jgi:hypothetical protein
MKYIRWLGLLIFVIIALLITPAVAFIAYISDKNGKEIK